MPIPVQLSNKLSARERNLINEEINKSLKRTYFPSIGKGWGEVVEAIGTAGFEIDGFLWANGPEGTRHIDLARTNPDDSFSPVSIQNAVIVFSWHRMESGNYEITAYVS